MVGIFFSPLAPGAGHLRLALACGLALGCAWLFLCAGGAAQYLTTPTLGFPLLFSLLSSLFSFLFFLFFLFFSLPSLFLFFFSFSPFSSFSLLTGGCWCIAPHCRRSGGEILLFGQKMALLLACEIKNCYFCGYGR